MSELKIASCFEFEKVLNGKSNKLFYSKSEADKVIAEKDAKILALDAEVFKQKHHAKLFFDERNYAEIQLRHQKYKRCLAMEDFCESQYHYYNTLGNGFWLVRGDKEKRDEYRKKASDFWRKWRNRWHELAEKFKEAK